MAKWFTSRINIYSFFNSTKRKGRLSKNQKNTLTIASIATIIAAVVGVVGLYPQFANMRRAR